MGFSNEEIAIQLGEDEEKIADTIRKMEKVVTLWGDRCEEAERYLLTVTARRTYEDRIWSEKQEGKRKALQMCGLCN